MGDNEILLLALPKKNENSSALTIRDTRFRSKSSKPKIIVTTSQISEAGLIEIPDPSLELWINEETGQNGFYDPHTDTLYADSFKKVIIIVGVEKLKTAKRIAEGAGIDTTEYEEMIARNMNCNHLTTQIERNINKLRMLSDTQPLRPEPEMTPSKTKLAITAPVVNNGIERRPGRPPGVKHLKYYPKEIKEQFIAYEQFLEESGEPQVRKTRKPRLQKLPKQYTKDNMVTGDGIKSYFIPSFTDISNLESQLNDEDKKTIFERLQNYNPNMEFHVYPYGVRFLNQQNKTPVDVIHAYTKDESDGYKVTRKIIIEWQELSIQDGNEVWVTKSNRETNEQKEQKEQNKNAIFTFTQMVGVHFSSVFSCIPTNVFALYGKRLNQEGNQIHPDPEPEPYSVLIPWPLYWPRIPRYEGKKAKKPAVQLKFSSHPTNVSYNQTPITIPNSVVSTPMLSSTSTPVQLNQSNFTPLMITDSDGFTEMSPDQKDPTYPFNQPNSNFTSSIDDEMQELNSLLKKKVFASEKDFQNPCKICTQVSWKFLEVGGVKCGNCLENMKKNGENNQLKAEGWDEFDFYKQYQQFQSLENQCFHPDGEDPFCFDCHYDES